MEEPVVAPTLSRDQIVKHWLLNVVVECPTGLNRIFPLPNTLSLNTKAVPNAMAADYARCLVELFVSGMITFSSELSEDDLSTRAGVSRIVERFLSLPSDYQRVRYLRSGKSSSLQIDKTPALQVSYALTALGGKAWENSDMPQWERFIAAYTLCPEDAPWEGEMFSPDRDLLFAWMGWYPEVRHEKILLDSIKWEICEDFEVLYWKHLPLVHRVTFQVESAEPRWKSYKVPEWFHAWWTQSLHWHKDPWELPNWPAE